MLFGALLCSCCGAVLGTILGVTMVFVLGGVLPFGVAAWCSAGAGGLAGLVLLWVRLWILSSGLFAGHNVLVHT